MSKQAHQICVELPYWLDEFIGNYTATNDIRAQMAFVIAASEKNIITRSGGPFAAGIFEQGSGNLVSLGVNLVTQQNSSILHAEMLALALAQQKLGQYDLSPKQKLATETANTLSYQLVTSTEPCAMCLGAIPWSGVRKVICGARGECAEEIGFDEGDKPACWESSLQKRGIAVLTGVCQAEAEAVLSQYSSVGGIIY